MNTNISSYNELSTEDAKCTVCHTGSKFCDNNMKKGIRSKLLYCKCCKLSIHVHKIEHLRNIYSYIPGKTCHDIVQSQVGKYIWHSKSDEQKKEKFYFNRKHEIIAKLKNCEN